MHQESKPEAKRGSWEGHPVPSVVNVPAGWSRGSSVVSSPEIKFGAF